LAGLEKIMTTICSEINSNGLISASNGYMGLLYETGSLTNLFFFVGSGLILVSVVFFFSAVAIPYILDRDANFIEAIITSYKTVSSNPAAMFTWAIAIAVLTAIDVATAFVGLVILFPVLGYATWHSYRALVK
jgi:uncharacterized membrane protein